jgi:hypothetical protein
VFDGISVKKKGSFLLQLCQLNSLKYVRSLKVLHWTCNFIFLGK